MLIAMCIVRSFVGSPFPLLSHVVIITAGHLSLVKEARTKNDIVVASIFVNPTQFGKGEDLDKYPHQMEADFELLSSMGVVRFVVLPGQHDFHFIIL